MGFGNRPALTPAHQFERETGTNLRTCLIRSNPVSGISCILGISESFDMSCPPLLIFGEHTEGTITIETQTIKTIIAAKL
jgi:hypothetical protein